MKIYMETYGCTTNQGDALTIRGILEEKGHEIVKTLNLADSLILVTCTVISTTEQRMIHRLHRFIKEKKPIIVTGCMASAQPELIKKVAPDAILLPPRYFHHVNDLIEGKKPNFSYRPKTSLPRHLEKIAIIPISEGCPFACSYCITKKARGEHISYPMPEILDDIRKIIRRGCKEIRITSQDTASYGYETGFSLPLLMREISLLKGDFMIRIGMMNPLSTIKIMDDLIHAYANKKIFKFLHLPVQSGSNTILKNMHRGYTVQIFQDIIKTFRENFPDINIATDIIVAFPGETNKQFTESCQLINKIRPDIVNITRFSARPNTTAKSMHDRIPTHIAKNRSRKMTHIVNKLSKEKNEEKIGKKYRVLVLEKRKNWFVGRTENYKSVYLNKGTLEEWINVEIQSVTTTHLLGKPVQLQEK